MIEEVVVSYLSDALSVPVHVMQPNKPPASYVIVEKTSGGVGNQVPRATIAIQSYAPTVYGASKLNEEVKEAMAGIVALDEIGRCHLETDYSFTDTARKVPRYQAVYDIRHY